MEQPDLRVLVIDDDDGVRAQVRKRLEADGIAVEQATDGERGLEMALMRPPHLVVLDLVLPGMSGLAVLDCLRSHRDIPVILLSGLGDEADRVSGLERGADDYIVKPFSGRELLARIRSVLRRVGAPSAAAEQLVFDGLVIDVTRREVLVDDLPVELTRREFDLLAFLAGAPRQTFTRTQLLEHVWGSSAEWQTEATITEHVHRVRNRLGLAERSHGPTIRTMRGVGYAFEPGGRTAGHQLWPVGSGASSG